MIISNKILIFSQIYEKKSLKKLFSKNTEYLYTFFLLIWSKYYVFLKIILFLTNNQNINTFLKNDTQKRIGRQFKSIVTKREKQRRQIQTSPIKNDSSGEFIDPYFQANTLV